MQNFLDLFKIDDSKYSNEQLIALKTLLQQYKSIFAVHDLDIGKNEDIRFSISLDANVAPIKRRAYPVPLRLRDKVAEKLQTMEEMDIIEKS